MVTYYLYRLINSLRFDKCGATTGWDKRCRNNRAFHGDQCIITELETMEGPNTPEMWQVVGDREWELADEYGYPRGEHYRSAREKWVLARLASNTEEAKLKKSITLLGNTNSISRQIFTFEQAEEIRTKYNTGNYSQRSLAEEYNTIQGNIFNILKNKTYQA